MDSSHFVFKKNYLFISNRFRINVIIMIYIFKTEFNYYLGFPIFAQKNNENNCIYIIYSILSDYFRL